MKSIHKLGFNLSTICQYLAFCLCILSLPTSAVGYVDKDSYLYPIMIDIRHKKYDEAMEKLESYAEKGDAKALFWYGYMKQQNHGRDRYSAYEWYAKAAQLGNPYAMFKLSNAEGTDTVCEANGWNCSDENLERAINRWSELASKGDIAAEYWANLYGSSFLTRLYHNKSGITEQRTRAACEQGYCQPLVLILKGSHEEHSREYWGDAYYEMIIDFVYKDPAIATYCAAYAHEGLSDEQRIGLIIDSLKKGYYPAANHLYGFAKKGSMTYEDVYVYATAANLGGSENAATVLIENKKLVPESKLPDLKIKAKVFFDEIQHVINFDEMNFMYRHKPDV